MPGRDHKEMFVLRCGYADDSLPGHAFPLQRLGPLGSLPPFPAIPENASNTTVICMVIGSREACNPAIRAWSACHLFRQGRRGCSSALEHGRPESQNRLLSICSSLLHDGYGDV